MKKKWIPLKRDKNGNTHTFKCPYCNKRIHMINLVKTCTYNYCPNCGSDMALTTNEQIPGQMSLLDYFKIFP